MDFFAIAWLIPLLPLLACVVITLLAPFYRNRLISAWLAIGALLIATLLAWGLLLQGVTTLFAPGHSPPAAGQEGAHGAAHFTGFGPAYSASLLWTVAGETPVRFGYRIDAPVALMLAMVTLAALCIHLFSLGYMARDEYPPGHERQSRFFAFIALFTAAMLGMVMADNLLLFFICWEVMGLCSYLLIGFWYFKPSAYHAARKAFITTRIGDVLMMLGLFFLSTEAGSLTLGSDDGQIFAPAFLERISTQTTWAGMSVATAIALLLFMGTVGKSAQFPLHVWLPDAMEGPTPVSALIHAATMVAAGVFLVARTYPIFLASPTALTVVALIGTFTALFAAVIAVAQFDIKRILAYSTLSQLGFMVAALGVGGWVAALFHLLTHAFFKALLFLGAGSVIHGMEAAVGHDPERAQDIRNMGGLARWMRTTWLTYLIGAAALAGVPFFSGFFSKDEILLEAFQRGDALGWTVYLTLMCAAFLTAFYMTRQVVVVFHGPFRGFAPRPLDPRQEYSEAVPVESPDVPPALTPEVAAPALGVSATAAQATHHHGAPHPPHESPLSMTLPLIVLAVLALGAGLANLPDWGLPLPAHWLADVLGQPAPAFRWSVAGSATLVALAGIALGALVYRGAFVQATDPDPLAARLPGLFRVLNAAFYVDAFYAASLGRLVRWLGRALAAFDRRVIDGAVTGIGLGQVLLAKINFIIDDLVLNQGADTLANSTQYTGDGLRQTITGKIQDYGVLIFVGILLIALVYLYAF